MTQSLGSDLLADLDLVGPVSSQDTIDLYDAADELREAARKADEGGQLQQAEAYRLICSIAQMHFRPDDKVEPYGPLASFANGSRTAQGSDLSREVCDALFKRIDEFKLLPLRLRVADLAWLNDRRNAAAARQAIDTIVEIAEASLAGRLSAKHSDLRAGNHVVAGILARGLSIAFATGWDKAENDALRTVLVSSYEGAKMERGPNFSRAAELVLRAGVIEPKGVHDDAMRLSREASDGSDFDASEWSLNIAISAAIAAKDDGAIKAAKLALSEVRERKAEGLPAGFLKTHAFEQAIDALKGLKDVRERRRALHLKLADAQIDVLDDFSVIEHEMDITDVVKQTRDAFGPLSLFEALREFALIAVPSEPDDMIRDAQEMGQKFVLSGLFPVSVVNDQGQTVAREGHTEIGEASRHTILRNESIRIGLSVRGQIEHAREIIYGEKDISESHLLALCQFSPFVPPHAVAMISEGLFAFFQRDYAKAGAFMIPYLESCLRQVIESSGEPSTVIKDGGTESNLMLSSLLSKHRDILEQRLTPRYVFAIENLFDHPLGDKIRHQHAHGMFSRGHYFSQNVIYSLWLMYSLVVLPLVGQWEEVEKAVQSRVAI